MSSPPQPSQPLRPAVTLRASDAADGASSERLLAPGVLITPDQVLAPAAFLDAGVSAFEVVIRSPDGSEPATERIAPAGMNIAYRSENGDGPHDPQWVVVQLLHRSRHQTDVRFSAERLAELLEGGADLWNSLEQLGVIAAGLRDDGAAGGAGVEPIRPGRTVAPNPESVGNWICAVTPLCEDPEEPEDPKKPKPTTNRGARPRRWAVTLRAIDTPEGAPLVRFLAEGVLIAPDRVLAPAGFVEDGVPPFEVVIRDLDDDDAVVERIAPQEVEILYRTQTDDGPQEPQWAVIVLSRPSRHRADVSLSREGLTRLLQNGADLWDSLEMLGVIAPEVRGDGAAVVAALESETDPGPAVDVPHSQVPPPPPASGPIPRSSTVTPNPRSVARWFCGATAACDGGDRKPRRAASKA
jgi:hypothetical protein